MEYKTATVLYTGKFAGEGGMVGSGVEAVVQILVGGGGERGNGAMGMGGQVGIGGDGGGIRGGPGGGDTGKDRVRGQRRGLRRRAS